MLDDELLPAYAPAGLRALAIDVGEQTAFAEVVARDADLGLPMLFDLDWLVFDRYRVPGSVFPLTVVIDREGRVAHVDTAEDLSAAEAAVIEVL